MRLQELTESTLTINDLLSPAEMDAAINDIKEDKDTKDWEDLVAHRIRERGMNVPLNIGVFLRWKKDIDMGVDPDKYKTPDTSGAWEDYATYRRKGTDQYTGD